MFAGDAIIDYVGRRGRVRSAMHALATLLSGRTIICSVLFLLVGAAVASPVAAAPGVGYDISYPQCGLPFPSDPAFGIIGVNGGRAFTPNPCLAEQLAWAKKAANRASVLREHGESRPGVLGALADRPDESAPVHGGGAELGRVLVRLRMECGEGFVRERARASQTVNGVDEASARKRVAAVKWWLDVEILNSWQTLTPAYGMSAPYTWNDVYALTGAVRGLWDSGVAFVGIYSTEFQWNLITGGSAYTRDWFSANPVWLAGFTATSAPGGCAKTQLHGRPRGDDAVPRERLRRELPLPLSLRLPALPSWACLDHASSVPVRATFVYQRALAFGVRRRVAKSTWTIPKRWA